MRVLHDQHAPALRPYALQLTSGDRARAEDVVQETLLRAWRHPKVLDQSERSARSWLLTVARRIAIDEWRTGTSRAEVVTDAPPEPGTADDADRAVQGWLVADALGELSPRHREVLALCFYRGMSVADAAAQLDVPGTRVDVDCEHEGGRGGDYVLVVVRGDGTSEALARWFPTPDNNAVLKVTTPLRRNEIRSLELRTPSGPALLRLPVTR